MDYHCPTEGSCDLDLTRDCIKCDPVVLQFWVLPPDPGPPDPKSVLAKGSVTFGSNSTTKFSLSPADGGKVRLVLFDKDPSQVVADFTVNFDQPKK